MQGSLMLDIDGLWLTAEDRAILRQPQVGGLILFARNIADPQQVRELCRTVHQLRPDLLIAVDQEGGRVQRLRRGFTRLPSMRAIAAANNPLEAAETAGWLMATEIREVGIDFSFAPVLDLDYGHNTVIAERSFSADPALVIRLGRAFIQGIHKAGSFSVGKHFPGHGWVNADSHFAIPVDERSLEEIQAVDLQVFASLVEHLDGVMPAHVIYPAVDAAAAGFSPIWLQNILRKKLGFSGVIFSDDLSMAGAEAAGEVSARVRAAVAAGCDIVLVCNDRAAAEQALCTLQQDAVMPASRIAGMRAHRVAQSTVGCPRWQAARQTIHALTR